MSTFTVNSDTGVTATVITASPQTFTTSPATSNTYTVDGALRGPTGPAGANGQGIPTGGTTGQILKKNSNTDYDTVWSTSAGSGIARSISTVSTPTTAGSTASTDYIYLVSGTTTLTLPTAVGNTNRYTVTNVGSNTVTVATTSAQTINGSSTATLPIANMSLDLISDNANWHVE